MTDFLDAVRHDELRERRIHFGDGDTQSIPGEWAEPFIRYVYAHNRNLFGDAVLHVLGATREDKRRRG